MKRRRCATITRNYKGRKAKRIPAATAEPITPATLGPIACIKRKLPGLYCWPTVCDTRAAIGTADTPAEPISGLIFSLLKRFIIFAKITPDAEPNENATIPNVRMPRVFQLRKASAVAVAPTEIPRKMVTMFINSFCTVFDKRSVTPHSFIKLPNIKQPISGAAEGKRMAMIR